MSSKLFDLSGRTGLVTGSARGLGNALAEAGATIVLNGLNTAGLSSAAAALRQNICRRRSDGRAVNLRTSLFLSPGTKAMTSLIPTSVDVLGDFGAGSEIFATIVEVS